MSAQTELLSSFQTLQFYLVVDFVIVYIFSAFRDTISPKGFMVLYAKGYGRIAASKNAT